jgi:plasmid stabilization system protein ParE
MSKRVIVEPEAEADLLEGYEWYERQRTGLGDDFLLCFEAILPAIGQRPTSFPVVERRSRRVLLHRFPYFALFVEEADVILVVGVFHTKRDPKTWQHRAR